MIIHLMKSSGASAFRHAVGTPALTHGRARDSENSRGRHFREIAQAHVDHSVDKAFRSFLSPALLTLDDLGLHLLSQQQSIDLYELGTHLTARPAL